MIEKPQAVDIRSAIRRELGRVPLKLVFRASGRKTSEGDGRTAADIRRELAAAKETTDGA